MAVTHSKFVWIAYLYRYSEGCEVIGPAFTLADARNLATEYGKDLGLTHSKWEKEHPWYCSAKCGPNTQLIIEKFKVYRR